MVYKKKIENNCLNCPFLTQGKEFGFYNCLHPAGEDVFPTSGQRQGPIVSVVRPSKEHRPCPLFTNPVMYVEGARGW